MNGPAANPAAEVPLAALPGLFARRGARGDTLLALAIAGLILGCTALQRFGLTLGEASLNAAHFGAYALLAAGLLSARMALAPARLAVLCALLATAGLSWLVNHQWGAPGDQSPASFALLVLMYAPFVFVLRPAAGSTVDTEWVLRAFANVGLACAVAGIAQFGAQFVIRADWLFDFSPYLPPWLRSSGGYNTVIPVGELFKSNGFFFKEPSLFSLVMAFALLLEIARFRRWLRLAVLVLALALTYSGSGLLVLAFGLLFPLRLRTFMRLAAAALVGAGVAWLLWDALNLDFTLRRLEEFSQPRSSAYMRYVAPLRLLAESITQHPWTVWLGYGPGTIYRTGAGWGWFFEYHDPTAAKLLFEYGLAGLVLAVTLAWLTLRNPAVPIQVRAAAFFCWLATGGFLLTPELTYLMIVFGQLLLPAAAAGRGAAEFAEATGAPDTPGPRGAEEAATAATAEVAAETAAEAFTERPGPGPAPR
jgi:hypothetical protein